MGVGREEAKSERKGGDGEIKKVSFVELSFGRLRLRGRAIFLLFLLGDAVYWIGTIRLERKFGRVFGKTGESPRTTVEKRASSRPRVRRRGADLLVKSFL